MRFALCAVLTLAACTQPRSKTCTDICSRENDCMTSTNSQIPFDEKECIVACEMLRDDQQNLAKVEQHKECVLAKASTCTEVLDCP